MEARSQLFYSQIVADLWETENSHFNQTVLEHLERCEWRQSLHDTGIILAPRLDKDCKAWIQPNVPSWTRTTQENQSPL